MFSEKKRFPVASWMLDKPWQSSGIKMVPRAQMAPFNFFRLWPSNIHIGNGTLNSSNQKMF